MADLKTSISISAAGLRVQSQRMKVIAENIANADSLASTPGGSPYQRKTIHFKNEFDKALGANTIRVARYGVDDSAFPIKHDPGHPAANEAGYVQHPNVNTMIEGLDMREAQRTYEANLSAIEVTKSMVSRTLDLLR